MELYVKKILLFPSYLIFVGFKHDFIRCDVNYNEIVLLNNGPNRKVS